MKAGYGQVQPLLSWARCRHFPVKSLPLPSCSPTFISRLTPHRLSSWKKIRPLTTRVFSFLLHHQFQPPDPYSLQLLEWNSSPFNFCLTWRRYLSYLYTTSTELTSPTVSFHLQAPSNLERIHLNKANGSGTHQHHACGTKEPYMAWMH